MKVILSMISLVILVTLITIPLLSDKKEESATSEKETEKDISNSSEMSFNENFKMIKSNVSGVEEKTKETVVSTENKDEVVKEEREEKEKEKKVIKVEEASITDKHEVVVNKEEEEEENNKDIVEKEIIKSEDKVTKEDEVKDDERNKSEKITVDSDTDQVSIIQPKEEEPTYEKPKEVVIERDKPSSVGKVNYNFNKIKSIYGSNYTFEQFDNGFSIFKNGKMYHIFYDTNSETFFSLYSMSDSSLDLATQTMIYLGIPSNYKKLLDGMNHEINIPYKWGEDNPDLSYIPNGVSFDFASSYNGWNGWKFEVRW
ncbi:hypothetical protein [Virgibacillus sp. DJP39]|uniref:hypothetical protein n=1 Tax=Virgibacillus sp. DJP39 TaxID=3409790 RepID=UPI003BB7C8FE